MKSIRISPAVAVGACAALVLAAFGVRAVQGADDASPKPVAKIRDVMIAINGDIGLVPQLKDAVKKGELTDDDWEGIEARSAMVAEAGNLLLALKPPLGADNADGLAGWKKHVLEYRACAETIHEASHKKDAAAAAEGVKGLTKRCSECHKDHRPKE